MKTKYVIYLIISLSSITFTYVLGKMINLDSKVLLLLIFISLSLLVYSSMKLIDDFKFESKYFKFTLHIFLFYELTIIMRGWSFASDDLLMYCISSVIFWPYFIPLFALINKDFSTLIIFLKWIYNVGLFFLILVLIFPTLLIQRLTAESVIGLSYACGYILLFGSYINTKKVNISFFIVFISFLSLTYLARRSGMLTLLGFLISSYLLSIRSRSKLKINRIFPVVIVFIILFLSGFNNITTSLIKKIDERLVEDTRTEVFEYFLNDMQDHLIFGKGMNGKYYCPISGGIEEEGIIFAEVEYREVIENGYLQLVLTGGILHMTLFLLILFPAAFLGIFRSVNLFSKACGISILLWLIDMFAYGLPSLYINYIFVWVCVGICYKTSFRNRTDDEIHLEFQKNRLT